jgi:FkbM family methyltransferase
MSNDPRDLSGAKLRSALLHIGRDLELRSELVAWLHAAEKRLNHNGAVRDDVTGPIVDALHHEDDAYEKTLADGTQIGYLYRTKIARDFLMSERAHPTHVWEPQTTRLLVHFINGTSGDALVGGAYCGDQAVLMAKAMSSPNRKVHCFEPNAVQSAVLAGNARRNDLTNLVICTQGLWDEAGLNLRLEGYDSFANSTVTGPDAETVEGTVETETIDAYVDRQGCTLSLIMLDIEGGELRALQGAQHVLASQKPVVVFEVHRDYVDWSSGLEKTPIASLLTAHGYRVFALRDFNGNQEMGDRKIELIPADAVYLEGPPHGFNMVALPDSQRWDNDLFRTVRDVSPKLLWHKSPRLHHPSEDQ